MAVAPYRNEGGTAVTGGGTITQLKILTIRCRLTETRPRRTDGLFELRLERSRPPQLGKEPRPERGHAHRRRAADHHRADRAEQGGHGAGAHLAKLVGCRNCPARTGADAAAPKVRPVEWNP